jgi:hypothetical protein
MNIVQPLFGLCDKIFGCPWGPTTWSPIWVDILILVRMRQETPGNLRARFFTIFLSLCHKFLSLSVPSFVKQQHEKTRILEN